MSKTPLTDAQARNGAGAFDQSGMAGMIEYARRLELQREALLAALNEIITDSSCSAYSAQIAEKAINQTEATNEPHSLG